MNKKFCLFPFSNLEVHNDGESYLCCPTWLPRPIGSLLKNSFDDVWNSQQAQEIRRSILDGSFEYCDEELCPFLKAGKWPVIDLANTSKLGTYEKQILDSAEIQMKQGPSRLNCSYDRSCNLSCPSCRQQNYNLKIGTQEYDNVIKIQNELLNRLSQIRQLRVTGSGDPFASPAFFNMLKNIQAEYYPQLVIFLHTNGLLWTKKRWDLLKSSRDLIKKAEISIDAATETTYAINRRGAFSRLLENLQFISELRRENRLQLLMLSFVVQKNNYNEMLDFIQLGKKFGVDRIYFSKLLNWGTFSEEEYKKRAVHMPEHPENSEFQKLLKHSVFKSSRIFLGNLSS